MLKLKRIHCAVVGALALMAAQGAWADLNGSNPNDQTLTGSIDIALNPSKSGNPSPLQSDPGWGGGTNTWQIVDGYRSYDTFASGLAFTGGSGNYGGAPAGPRQATIDFGGMQTFNQVAIFHQLQIYPISKINSKHDQLQYKYVHRPLKYAIIQTKLLLELNVV